MAREKGMGNLQREKSGRWTMRVGLNGKRYCRSTRTTDRDKAERILQRFLAPLGLGDHRLPLAEVWNEYVKSPNRNDLSPATLNAKRVVWMSFARWMEHNHLEVGDLAGVTPDAIGEYLACIRAEICAASYNNRVCVLREIFHTLAAKAGLEDDPWEGVRLRSADSHSRRELTMDELIRLLDAAKNSSEWHTLFLIGIYTGLRLGDCCRLDWSNINIAQGVIQLIPKKTQRHAHGHPVTIPIHPALGRALLERKSKLKVEVEERNLSTCAASPLNAATVGGDVLDAPQNQNGGSADRSSTSTPNFDFHSSTSTQNFNYPPQPQPSTSTSLFIGPVLPTICEMYRLASWRITHELSRLFRAAGIVTSVRIEGRRRKTPEATFHSLRHTFVSFAANAGVPLHIVQSIVGHESTAMTRHYYHENIAALQSAVAAIPTLS